MTKHFVFLVVMFSALVLSSGCGTSRLYYNDPPLQFSDIGYPFSTEHATLNGTDIYYHDSKNGGTPVVLIHGLASNMGFWRSNIPALEKAGLRVIAIDLPGYGMSAKPYSFPYSLTSFSKTARELVKHLGLSSAIFVGHSMGGQIALVTALQEPSIVKKLILLSPAGLESFKEGEANWLRNAVTPTFIKSTTEDRVRANLVANFYSWDDQWEWMVEERVRMTKADDFDRFTYATWKSVGAMIDEPVWEKLGKVSAPALIIGAENDNLIPNPFLHGGWTRDVMEYGKSRMPNAQLIMIPHAGHMVQLEASDRVNEAIVNFSR